MLKATNQQAVMLNFQDVGWASAQHVGLKPDLQWRYFMLTDCQPPAAAKPAAGTTLGSAQACMRRRAIAPTISKPTPNMAQVSASGTAATL